MTNVINLTDFRQTNDKIGNTSHPTYEIINGDALKTMMTMPSAMT